VIMINVPHVPEDHAVKTYSGRGDILDLGLR
jgi:hypothetical protein